MRNVFATLLAALFLMTPGLSGTALAEEAPPAPSNGSSEKLARGLSNGFTGWMEAPATVQKFHRERGLFDALTTGVARGVGLAIARTGAGIYETATFPFAAPENYEPVIMPERVES